MLDNVPGEVNSTVHRRQGEASHRTRVFMLKNPPAGPELDGRTGRTKKARAVEGTGFLV